MPRKEDIHHSILIVSAAEQFDALVKRSLTGFLTIDVRRSAAIARRSTLERDYDLVVINAPLPDEAGAELAMDIMERSNASILLVVPQEVYEDAWERVMDYGILVLSKPIPRGRIDKAVRFLTATQNRFHRLEKKTQTVEEKMEELRIVSRAKIMLVEKRHMTEDEAHRFIGKQAMNNGVSRKRVAEKLLEEIGE